MPTKPIVLSFPDLPILLQAALHPHHPAQRKAGIEKPVFNPQKLGIKNADLWMEINADKIAKEGDNEVHTGN